MTQSLPDTHRRSCSIEFSTTWEKLKGSFSTFAASIFNGIIESFFFTFKHYLLCSSLFMFLISVLYNTNRGVCRTLPIQQAQRRWQNIMYSVKVTQISSLELSTLKLNYKAYLHTVVWPPLEPLFKRRSKRRKNPLTSSNPVFIVTNFLWVSHKIKWYLHNNSCISWQKALRP